MPLLYNAELNRAYWGDKTMSNKKLLPTFQDWKTLHESLGGAIPLGIKTPASLGVVGSVTTSLITSNGLEEALEELDLMSIERLEEACKKAKSKKKMLVDLGKPEDKEIDVDPKKHDDDEEDDEKGDHDEPDEDDEIDDDDDELADKPELGLKKPGLGLTKPELLLAKKKAVKKAIKKMAAEAASEDDWWGSVKTQMTGDTTQRWDGVAEPAAGEPGFAPQTRIGWFQ